MTKPSKIIIFFIATILIYITLNFLCKFGVKCKNCPEYSSSIEESKKEKLYIASYKPEINKIKLKYHIDTVEFITGWAEHSWFVNSDNCLFKKKEKTEGYNLTIEFRKYPSDTFNFSLYGYGVGWGMGHSSKTMRISSLYDTLIFQIVEKNPDLNIGWKNELVGEQIKFVKIK